MNSKKNLTGDELEQIYLIDKSSELLTEPDNLKKLLNHALNKKDKMDSNFDMEIIDFCVKGLDDSVPLDKERIAFMKEKQDFIAREQEKKRIFYSMSKMAAAAAMFVIIVGGVFFGNTTQVEAGLFDWISRLFAVVKEDGGEQLSFRTPDATLTALELEEGHLPDTLPEGYEFENSYYDTSDYGQKYDYRFFNNARQQTLSINILEYNDALALSNSEIEITKNSSYTVEDNDTTYYYSENIDRNYISWVFDNKIYKINGNFPFDELEKVLSHYKEEQIK